MKIKDKKWLAIGVGTILLIGGFVAIAGTPQFQASVLQNNDQQSSGGESPGGQTGLLKSFNTLSLSGCEESDFDKCYEGSNSFGRAYAEAVVQASEIDIVTERSGVNYVEKGTSVDYACGSSEDAQEPYHDTYLYFGDGFEMSWNGEKPMPLVDNYRQINNEGSFDIDWEKPRSIELICVGYNEHWGGEWVYHWQGINWYGEYSTPPDKDGDGVIDFNDQCPNQAGTRQTDGCPDSDGDGVRDSEDEFPLDPECVEDSDGDGVCDNKDAFPNDSNKQFDQDDDGVADSVDQCPRRAGSPETNGCPDSDGDGIPDNKDQCPNQGDQGFGVDSSGCPIQDSDGDGVSDAIDQCPGTPSQAPVDSKGCAVDSDNDGVPNYQDECPNTGDPKLGVNDQGCAVQDEDQDGVTDSVDECPQTWGSKTNGCPTFVDQIINTLGLRGLFS